MPTQVGTPTDIVWGTDGAYASGIVTSAKDQRTGELREIKNNDGDTVTVVLFDGKNECEVTVLAQEASVLPARGDFVTLCGIASVIVKEVEQNWQNGQEQTFTIRGTKYDAITAP